jgi:hypothetical protein
MKKQIILVSEDYNKINEHLKQDWVGGMLGGSCGIVIATKVSRRRWQVESFEYSVSGDETSMNYDKHYRTETIQRGDSYSMNRYEFGMWHRDCLKRGYAPSKFASRLLCTLLEDSCLSGVKESSDAQGVELEEW